MQDQPIAKSFHKVTCQKCSAVNVVGMDVLPPSASFVLTEEDMLKKKNDLLAVIRESSLPEEQKKELLETYGVPGMILDPEFAGMMIANINQKYAKN